MIVKNAQTLSRQQGFTLIELVLVIILITVASVPLFGLFTRATTSLLDNEDIQIAAQLAQEQAENILARRRAGDFADVAPGTTTEPTIYSSFNRTTVVTQPAPGGCPGGTVCDAVRVSVDRGGPVLSEVTFLLVDY